MVLPLRKILTRKNLTQAWLANKLSTTEATVSRYINQKMAMPTAVLLRISEVLEVLPEEVLGELPIMTDDERATILAYLSSTEATKAAVRAMLAAAAPNKNLRDTQETD